MAGTTGGFTVPFTKGVFKLDKNRAAHGLSDAKTVYKDGVRIRNWWDNVPEFPPAPIPPQHSSIYRDDFVCHVVPRQEVPPRQRAVEDSLRRQATADVNQDNARTSRQAELANSNRASNALYSRSRPGVFDPPMPLDAPRDYHQARAVTVWSDLELSKGRNSDFSTPVGLGTRNHPSFYNAPQAPYNRELL
eukprot:gnl/Hemi2/21313_TR7075_c0_g1_i1.p1 gnl/Hemi2/21313_TR7075_c0_g1~~gnl/Hemi2/21313_TR7075_c0_g1_i1.p1  ORF type:complete len:191 (+),score=32.54 gnl/Hemi2/21313_TR7075_c0_g1_i1:51-623(+)